MGVALTDNVKEKVKQMYEDGIGSTTIAKALRIGETSVLRILKNNGIDTRSISQRKYRCKLDIHFFDVVDTEAKAYFLGFLYADGGNYRKKFHAVSLALQEEDAYIVETFADLIYGGNKKPHLIKCSTEDNNLKSLVRLVIYSKELSNALHNLGCVEKKSHVLAFPNFIPNNLMPHFIRGYFDGDGSIVIGKGTRSSSIALISSEFFCRGLVEYLWKNYKIKSKFAWHRNGKNGIVTITRKRNIHDFIKLIYSNSAPSYRLSRKYKKCMLFLEQYEVGHAIWDKDEWLMLIENIHLPTRKLKKFLTGRSTASIERQKAHLKKGRALKLSIVKEIMFENELSADYFEHIPDARKYNGRKKRMDSEDIQ